MNNNKTASRLGPYWDKFYAAAWGVLEVIGCIAIVIFTFDYNFEALLISAISVVIAKAAQIEIKLDALCGLAGSMSELNRAVAVYREITKER